MGTGSSGGDYGSSSSSFSSSKASEDENENENEDERPPKPIANSLILRNFQKSYSGGCGVRSFSRNSRLAPHSLKAELQHAVPLALPVPAVHPMKWASAQCWLCHACWPATG